MGARGGWLHVRRHAGPILGLIAAVAVSGCSVASYERPVDDFAAATEDAQAALVALNDEVTDAYAATIRQRVLSGDGLVQFKSGDCLMSSQRCRLVVRGRDGGETTLTPDPALKRTLVLMRGINSYAQGLAAIVAADTPEAIAGHVDQTVASVDNLATTVADLGGGDATPSVDTTPYTTAVGGIVSLAAGQYVDHRKVEALRRATADSKQVVARAAALFTGAADIATPVSQKPMAEAITQRLDAFDDNPTAGNLDRLIQSAAAYDRLLAARPPRIFQRMAAAHGALVDKLQGEEISLVVVFAKIEAFKDDAETLAALLRDLAEARRAAQTQEGE
jgi:hypothetical protein